MTAVEQAEHAESCGQLDDAAGRLDGRATSCGDESGAQQDARLAHRRLPSTHHDVCSLPSVFMIVGRLRLPASGRRATERSKSTEGSDRYSTPISHHRAWR